MDKAAEKKLLEIVRKNYEDIAGDFNETRKKELGSAWTKLIEFVQKINEGAEVLDLGCGNGRLLKAFAGKDIAYIGIDFIPELIEAARKNFKEPKARFITGDILELDKISETQGKKFDYIFCLAAYHHFPGRDLRVKFLKNSAGYLKAQGKIYLTVWNLWSQKKFRPYLLKSGLKKIFGRYPYDFGDIIFPWKGLSLNSPRYYHAFTKKELKNLAIDAGLEIEKLFKDKYNYYLIAGKSTSGPK